MLDKLNAIIAYKRFMAGAMSKYCIGIYRLYRDWHGYDVYGLMYDGRGPEMIIGPYVPRLLVKGRYAVFANYDQVLETNLAVNREARLSRRRVRPHPCPVCERHYFPNSWEDDICPECGWQDDVRMERHPTLITRITWNDCCLKDYKARYKRLCRLIPGYLWKLHGIPDMPDEEASL